MKLVNSKWIAAAAGLAGAAAWAEPLDARVSNTAGKSVWLAKLWGKPTVVFYEDKDSTAQNQALKDELYRQGKEKGLLEAASVIAIANVQGFDWFPARNFVVSSVKDTEKTTGIPVYLDWNGTLSKKPWSLSATGSTVMVFDSRGAKLFSHTGALSRDDIQAVFGLLASLVR